MKIGIVGSGMVGATTAHALVMRGVGREIVLIDKDRNRASAEAEDVSHAVPFSHPLLVKDGDYADLKGCRLVVISAGVSQRPGENRLNLLKRNAAVFKDVVTQILENEPAAILLVASNPVDIMTHLTARYAAKFDIPDTRVMGSGTTLDTARFRTLLGHYVNADSQHIHGYVIGEHGDSEVLTWSALRIGAMTLEDFCHQQDICLDGDVRKDIDDRVRNAAYRIIKGKGATYYGVATALAKIADAVLRDQRCILTVTTPAPEVAGVSDVSVSLPRLVGGEGILATFQCGLDDREQHALQGSAKVVREAIEELGEGI